MNPGLVVKLRPAGPWRIGPDSGARNRVDFIYHSDSLYSAVTSAMARLGSLDVWLDATARRAGAASAPAVCFSSCFPFLDEIGFVVPPRSVWPPVSRALVSARVRWKSARFVPLGVVQAILTGKRLDENHWTVDGASECLVPAGQLGPFRTGIRWSAAVDRLTGSTERHSTACIEFRPGAGLWTIVSFVDQAAHARWLEPVKAAFRLLADTGFGGERSRGWGRADSPEFIDGILPDMILPPSEPVRQPVEQPVAQQPVAQQPVSQQTVAQQPIDQQPVAQQPVSQQTVAQQPVSQQPVSQQSVSQQPVGQQSVGQEPVGQQPVDQQPVAQQPVGQQPVGQQAASEQPVAQQPVGQQPVSQQSVGQQPVNQQTVDQQPVSQQPVDQPVEPVGQALGLPTSETHSPASNQPVSPEPSPNPPEDPEPGVPVTEPPSEEPPIQDPPAEPTEAMAAVRASSGIEPLAVEASRPPIEPDPIPAPEPGPPSPEPPAPEPGPPTPEPPPEPLPPITEPELPAPILSALPSAELEPPASTPGPVLETEASTTEPLPEPEPPAARSEAKSDTEATKPVSTAPPTPEPAAATPSPQATTPALPGHPHWLLSLFTPAPADAVDWRRGNYTVLSRGGRVDSPAGSGELKKQIQMVAEGSVVYAPNGPCGTAADVAPDGFAHPVFRAGFAVSIPLPEVS